MSSVVEQAKNIIGRLSKRHGSSKQNRNPRSSASRQNPKALVGRVESGLEETANASKFGKFYLEKIAILNTEAGKNDSTAQTINPMREPQRKNEFGSGL